MNNLSNLLVLLGLITSNIYIADSYTLTSSVLTQLGYDTQSWYIGINDNDIDKIDPNAFNGYEVSNLAIVSTSLLSIDIEVFKNAVNLQYLVLGTPSLNKFTNSKNAILPNLLALGLSSNLTSLNKPMFNAFPALTAFDTGYVYSGNIKTIDVHTFESLSNLTHIGLRFNLLTGFEYLQIPKNLYQLNLGFNNMNYFALSRTMGVLDVLNINNNRFRSFKSMDFTFLANLTRLDLSNNPHAYPYEIAGHLKPLVKLEQVELANLNITTIDSNYFKNNTKLQKIDLSQNKISSLDYRAFNGLNDLYNLLLNNNSLTNIAPGTFNNLNSASINLASNQITQLDNLTFYGNSTCVVYLDDNKLTKILPRTFNDKFDLIRLNYNQITEIENMMFEGISLVKYLYLSNNKIAKIAPGSFSNLGLHYLDLSNNKIAKIAPGSFNNIGLYYLDLSNNDLTAINNTIFVGGIQIIKLGYNKLTTIETGSFANMPYLFEVYLDNNQLTQLDSSVFAGSNNLVKISVTGNPNLSTTNIQSLCPTAAINCQVLY